MPVDGETLPPRPENGPEIVRATGGRGRTLIVFKMPVAPGTSAAQVAAGARERLAAHGYEDFNTSDAGSADWADYLPLAEELARRFELVGENSAAG